MIDKNCLRCFFDPTIDLADAEVDPAADYAVEKCAGEGGHFYPEQAKFEADYDAWYEAGMP